MHFNRPRFTGTADKLLLHLGADTAAATDKRFTGTADKLPLHFNRPRFTGTADKLPFNFGGSGTTNPVDDGRFSMCMSASYGQSSIVYKCTTTAHAAEGFDDLVFVKTGLGVSVDKCLSVDVDSAHNFNNCITSRRGTGEIITQCLQLKLPTQALIENCHIVKHGEAVLLDKCVSVRTDYRGPALEICDVKTWGNAELLQDCKSTITGGEHLNNCSSVITDSGVMVQCDHYEIPELPPPEPPPKWVCERPSAKKLTLHFNKRNKREPASLLSFHFACEDDKITIPIRTTYMYEHKITAEYKGNPIEIFSCNFSRDISQHAWRGTIDISVESFNALTFPLPEIKVTINGVAWVVVVNNSDVLKFARESHSLDVRSLSYLLGESHFIPRANTYATQEYARQIVNKELAGTGFSIGSWSIVDWLIPAKTIKYDAKTPLEVINEVVKSVGGIVECDRVAKKLHIKPKWKVPAWQISSQTPDVEMHEHVVEEFRG